jgi:hypothetical protein
MPVTAKLSQAFYDRLGHDVADELVDWFNQVDTAYRSDLRELNELNFARFDARQEQRFAEFGRAIERQISQLAMDVKEQQVIQMRWMVGIWMVALLAIVGLWIRR